MCISAKSGGAPPHSILIVPVIQLRLADAREISDKVPADYFAGVDWATFSRKYS